MENKDLVGEWENCFVLHGIIFNSVSNYYTGRGNAYSDFGSKELELHLTCCYIVTGCKRQVQYHYVSYEK